MSRATAKRRESGRDTHFKPGRAARQLRSEVVSIVRAGFRECRDDSRNFLMDFESALRRSATKRWTVPTKTVIFYRVSPR